MTEDKRPESTLCAAATNGLDGRAQRPSDPRTAGPTGLSQRSAQQNKISLMTLGRKGRKGEEKERGWGGQRERAGASLCQQIQAGGAFWEQPSQASARAQAWECVV